MIIVRDGACGHTPYDRDQVPGCIICAQAEIERLRTSIALWNAREGDHPAVHLLAENERLRALLTPPEMIGHTHEWETVSAMGGPRLRCRGCGFLGLPAVETSGGPSVELYEVALSMLSALDHGTHIEPSSGFHTQLKTLLAEKAPALAPEGHKPTCFVYRYARALIGADRRGMCDCGFEASQIKQCPGLDIKEALTQASQ